MITKQVEINFFIDRNDSTKGISWKSQTRGRKFCQITLNFRKDQTYPEYVNGEELIKYCQIRLIFEVSWQLAKLIMGTTTIGREKRSIHLIFLYLGNSINFGTEHRYSLEYSQN